MAEILNGKQLQAAVLNGKQLFACVKNGRISYQRKPAVKMHITDIAGGEVISFARSFAGGQLVDWGDGTIDKLAQHTYSSSGNYNVSIYTSAQIVPDYFLADNIAKKISYLFIGSQIKNIGTFAIRFLANEATIEFDGLCAIEGAYNFNGVNNFTIIGLENLTYIGYLNFGNCSFTHNLVLGKNLIFFGRPFTHETSILNVKVDFFNCINLEEIGNAAMLQSRSYDWGGVDLDLRHTKLRKIDNAAFLNSINIKNLYLPDTFLEWGWDYAWPNNPIAFEQCAFESITLSPKTEKIIMNDPGLARLSAFAWGCKYILNQPIPPKTNFGYMAANRDAKIYVPDSALPLYSRTEGWQDIAHNLFPMGMLNL